MSNTQSHLIVTDEGLKIYKDDPASAILCEDQEKAKDIIIEGTYHQTPFELKIGSIYPVPGIEFEPVEVKCHAAVCEINKQCSWQKMIDTDTGKMLTKCMSRTVARLYRTFSTI